MIALDRFRERVEQLERGHVDADACRRLIDEMRLHPWQTAAERDKAQGLVARIERAMYRPENVSARPKSYQRPA